MSPSPKNNSFEANSIPNQTRLATLQSDGSLDDSLQPARRPPIIVPAKPGQPAGFYLDANGTTTDRFDLDSPAPNVNIAAKFAEITPQDNVTLTFDNANKYTKYRQLNQDGDLAALTPADRSADFAQPNYVVTNGGVDLLTAPEVTTESDRTAKLESPRATESKPAFSGIGPIYNGVVQNPQPFVETTPSSSYAAVQDGVIVRQPAGIGSSPKGEFPGAPALDRAEQFAHLPQVPDSGVAAKEDSTVAQLLQSVPTKEVLIDSKLVEQKQLADTTREAESQAAHALLGTDKAWDLEQRNGKFEPQPIAKPAGASQEITANSGNLGGSRELVPVRSLNAVGLTSVQAGRNATDSFSPSTNQETDTNVYSVSVVGYINLNLTNGVNLVANQLDSERDGKKGTVSSLASTSTNDPFFSNGQRTSIFNDRLKARGLKSAPAQPTSGVSTFTNGGKMNLAYADPQSTQPGSSLGPVNVLHYNSLKIDAETQYVKQAELLAKLKTLDKEELKQTIPTAAPDTVLAQLEQDHAATESLLKKLKSDLGPNHPDVQRPEKMLAENNKQIDSRVKGIVEGLLFPTTSNR